MGPLRKLLDMLSSMGLASALLLNLFLLTWFGTLHQVEAGLYQAQKLTARSAQLTGLDLCTTYDVYVRALDAAGNLSAGVTGSSRSSACNSCLSRGHSAF